MRLYLSMLTCLAVLFPVGSAQADDRRLHGAPVTSEESAADTGKVLCMAGCGSVTPVTVYQRPPGGPAAPIAAPLWKEHTFGVWCADGLGCKAIGNIRIGSRGYSHGYWYGTYLRGDPYWR